MQIQSCAFPSNYEIILKSGILYAIMNWHERIVADPGVLAGKPVIRGTRMAVEFVLDLWQMDGLKRR